MAPQTPLVGSVNISLLTSISSPLPLRMARRRSPLPPPPAAATAAAGGIRRYRHRRRQPLLPPPPSLAAATTAAPGGPCRRHHPLLLAAATLKNEVPCHRHLRSLQLPWRPTPPLYVFRTSWGPLVQAVGSCCGVEHSCLRVEDLLGNRAALCVSKATAKKLIQSRWYTICKNTSYSCELDRQTAMCPSVARRAKRSMTAQLRQGTEACYERIRLEFLKRLQE